MGRSSSWGRQRRHRVARSAARVGRGECGHVLPRKPPGNARPGRRNRIGHRRRDPHPQSWGPKRIGVRDGRVAGVEFKQCVSVFDATGRLSRSRRRRNHVCRSRLRAGLDRPGHRLGALLAGSTAELNPNQTLKAMPSPTRPASRTFSWAATHTAARVCHRRHCRRQAGGNLHPPFCPPGQSLTSAAASGIPIPGQDRAQPGRVRRVPRQTTGRIDGTKSKNSFRDLRVPSPKNRSGRRRRAA